MDSVFADVTDEIRYLLNLASYNVSDDEIEILAGLLCAKRIECHDEIWGCLHKGGSGVWCWLKSRMLEFGMLDDVGGQSEEDERLVVPLHFYPWDNEKYGPWNCSRELIVEAIAASTARSPLSRLSEAVPINKVARRVIQNNDHNCPYCKRYFRNPAALSLHIRDFHGYDE